MNAVESDGSGQIDFDLSQDRSEVLAQIKRRREQALDEAVGALTQSRQNGIIAGRTLSDSTDNLLRGLFTYCCQQNHVMQDELALVAVGGYGRSQLAPASDIDLLFLVSDVGLEQVSSLIEDFLYLMWDAGFKVGQATRTVAECIGLAKEDVTISTTLLESRFLVGDETLFAKLTEAYRSSVLSKQKTHYLSAKLEERNQRHSQVGASRYALEPNIKEGIGGLRDLQTLYWILKFLRGELLSDLEREGQLQADLAKEKVFTQEQAKTFIKAECFFWALRFHLHAIAGRAEERLTFDFQPEVAKRMGYRNRSGQHAVERFMSHYFFVAKSVGNLTRIVLSSVEKEHQLGSMFRLPRYLRREKTVDGFVLKDRRVGVPNRKWFKENPLDLIRIFAVAQRHRLDLDPNALRYVTQSLSLINRDFMQDQETNALFLQILTSRKQPSLALRRLNDAGVLGRFIPDFGRIVGMMQFDRYHHFTVDEHTIFAIEALWQLEQGTIAEDTPLSTAFMGRIKMRRALYVATFLHDIAKGRNGPHEVLGAEVAQRLCPRFGLDEQETDMVSWLVLNHLELSHIIIKRDIDDPQTVKDYVALVESIENARLLHILTSADIRAVGPGTWNSWKASMMRHMYFQTEDVLRGELVTEGRQNRISAIKQDVLSHLTATEVRDGLALDDFQTLVSEVPDSYWQAHTQYDMVRQFRLMAKADSQAKALTVDVELPSETESAKRDGPEHEALSIDPQRLRDDLRLIVYLDDHHGIVSRVAGAIAVTGATIEDAKIHTLKSGRALQVYTVKAINDDEATLASLADRLKQKIPPILAGQVSIAQALQERQNVGSNRISVFDRPPQVFIDNEAAERHTVIEVVGHNRPGTLYWITKALTDANLQIYNAKVAPLGTRFVDVFYVQDLIGQKIRSPERMDMIKQQILGNLRKLTAQLPDSNSETREPYHA